MFWARFIYVSWPHWISVSPSLCHLGEYSKRRMQKCLGVITIIKAFFFSKVISIVLLAASLCFPEITLLSFQRTAATVLGFCPCVYHSCSVDWPPLLINKGLTASHDSSLPPSSSQGLHITLKIFPSLVAQTVKNLPSMQETRVRSLGQEDPLANRMATHSSIFAWRIPWTEEPGGLQSMGSQRVGLIEWPTFTLKVPYWLLSSMIWTLSCLSLVLSSLDTCCKIRLCPCLFCLALPFFYLPVSEQSHSICISKNFLDKGLSQSNRYPTPLVSHSAPQ